MPSEIFGSTGRSVRQREFPYVFGWSARAESASTPNKLKFSFELPTCANSCLVLALPPQAVVQDCLTSARRVEKWTDIKLRLVGWDDFGIENFREQTDSRSRESLWLIELGGRQVVSFSIALGVGIRAQDDTRESEVHRYRQLIRSQNLVHFVEGQEIRTTCEAEVNLSQEPSPMRMSLSPASRLLRLFVDQQEVDWKVDNGWIQWSAAPVLPGATSAGRVRISAEFISPLSIERIEKLDMPEISFDRGYVMSGTTAVHAASPWRLTSVDCETSRIVEPTADKKTAGVNGLEFSWYAKPPSVSVGLERIVPVRRCELLTRLTNDEQGTLAVIRAKLFFGEQDSSQAKILIASGWTIQSITTLYPNDTIVVQPEMDSFASTRELQLSWDGVQKSRVGDVEIRMLHSAPDATSQLRHIEQESIVQWPGWKQYDTIVVEESDTFELQMRDSLLDDLVASDSIPDWQKSVLPRMNKHYLFRMESQPTDCSPDNQITESGVKSPASHLTGFVWLVKPIRNQAKLRTEINRISPTTLQAKHEIQISFGSNRNEPFPIELTSENTHWRLKEENNLTPLHPFDSVSPLSNGDTRTWNFDLRQQGSECTLLAIVNSDINDDHEVMFPVPKLPNAEMLVQEAKSMAPDVSIHCSDESSTWRIDDAGYKFLNFNSASANTVLSAIVSVKNPSEKWLANKNECHLAVDAFGHQKATILFWSSSPPRNTLAIELDYGWEPLSVSLNGTSINREVPFQMDGRRLVISAESLDRGESEGFEMRIELTGPRLMKNFSLETLSENFRFKWPELVTNANCLRQDRFLWLPIDMQIAELDNPFPLLEQGSWPVWSWSRSVVATLFGFDSSPARVQSFVSSTPSCYLVPHWTANGWRIVLTISTTEESSDNANSRKVHRIGKVDAVRSYLVLFFAFVALITPRLILFRRHFAAWVAAVLVVCAHTSSIGIARFAITGLVAMSVGFISFLIYWLLHRPGIGEKSVSERNSERWSQWNDRKGEIESEANRKNALPVPVGGSSTTNLRSVGICLAFGWGASCASSHLASTALGQEKSDRQTPEYRIVIPMDDKGNMAGTKVYVQNEMLDTLNVKSDLVRSVDDGTHPILAKYTLRVGKQGRGFSTPDQLIMRYDFLVGEDLTQVHFPINGSQLQLQRFFVDGFEVNLGRLRSTGLDWIWTPDKPGRHSIQIVSQPGLKSNETDRNREYSIQLLDIALLPIATATIEVETDKQNTIEIVSRGRVTNPEAGRFIAMLGAVDRLQCSVMAPINRLGGASSTLQTSISDSGNAPVMHTELFLQNDILQAKTIVDFPKGINIAREIEIEADLQWLPIGSQWGDAELVEWRSGTTLSRRRYVLEWKNDLSSSNINSVSTRDLRISVVWVPHSPSQSLNVLFAECLDRRTRRGTLRYSLAPGSNWSIEGIGTWNPVIDPKNRLDWPELKVYPYATTLSIPPNGGSGILKLKANPERQQARVTTKWVVDQNREYLTSRIELRGGSSTSETLFVNLPTDFLVTELYHRNRNEPIPFLQKKSNGKLQLQILAERKSLDELLIQAKRQTVEDTDSSRQKEWQALPWIELPSSINSDQTMEVLASEFVAIRLESEPSLFFGRGPSVPVLNLAKSFSDIYSNTLASSRYRLIDRDSPVSGKLTVKLNSKFSSRDIEVLCEFSISVSSRPSLVIEVPVSLRDRWHSESRINVIPCPDLDKAWLQVHLPEPTSLEGETQLTTLVRFMPSSDEPTIDLELANRIHTLDRVLIPTYVIKPFGNDEADNISAPNSKSARFSNGLSVEMCILHARDVNLLASPSSHVLMESQYWIIEAKGSHSAIGNLEWQLGDDVEVLSVMVNGNPIVYDQDGRRIRCSLAQAGLCADVVLFTKHKSSNKTGGKLNVDAPQLVGLQADPDIVLIDDPRVAVKLTGRHLLPTSQLKAIEAITETCLEVVENTDLPAPGRIDQGSDLDRWLKYWRHKAYRYLAEWSETASTGEQTAFGLAVQRWHALEKPTGFSLLSDLKVHRMEPKGFTLDQSDKQSRGINWHSLLGCLLILISITLLAPSFGIILCGRPWWYLLTIGLFVWIVFGTTLPILILGLLGLIVAADSYWIVTSRLRRTGIRGLRSL